MMAIIRIKGLVGIKKDIEETFNKLRLRKKFSCVVIREKPEILGMVKKLENCVAYGKIDNATLTELIEKRGESLKGEKIDAQQVVKNFMESKTEKKFSDFGIKNFFRLHPPRGGFDSKRHFPKGVLGNHGEKIKELIRRML